MIKLLDTWFGCNIQLLIDPLLSTHCVHTDVRISHILHCLSSPAVYIHLPSLLKPIVLTEALWASKLLNYKWPRKRTIDFWILSLRINFIHFKWLNRTSRKIRSVIREGNTINRLLITIITSIIRTILTFTSELSSYLNVLFVWPPEMSQKRIMES